MQAITSLVLVLLLFIFSSAHSQEHRAISTIPDDAEKVDTITVFDPVAELEVQTVRRYTPEPHFLNGKKVYSTAETTVPAKLGKTTNGLSPERYLLLSLSNTLRTFPNGRYRITTDYAIVDKRGRCIASRVFSAERIGHTYALPYSNRNDTEIIYDSLYEVHDMGKDTSTLLASTIIKVLSHKYTFTPARVGKKKVTAIYNLYTDRFDILINNGNISLETNVLTIDKSELMETLANENKGRIRLLKFLSRATPSSLQKD